MDATKRIATQPIAGDGRIYIVTPVSNLKLPS